MFVELDLATPPNDEDIIYLCICEWQIGEWVCDTGCEGVDASVSACVFAARLA